MRKLTVSPNDNYDKISVEKIDNYRRTIDDNGAIWIEVQTRQGGSWDDVEAANKYQDRTVRIKLDQDSVFALVDGIKNASHASRVKYDV
jgi:hypothetical protein